jgi:hypothetical protein
LGEYLDVSWYGVGGSKGRRISKPLALRERGWGEGFLVFWQTWRGDRGEALSLEHLHNVSSLDNSLLPG